MNIKKIEITDPIVLEAIKQRYEFMNGGGDDLSDVDFLNQVASLDRLIVCKLCLIYRSVVEARKFGAAK